MESASEIKMGKHRDVLLRKPRQNKHISQPKTGFREWKGRNKKSPSRRRASNKDEFSNVTLAEITQADYIEWSA